MVKTHFLYDCPDEVQVAVEGPLAAFEWLLPGWLLRITVRYEREGDASIRTTLRPSYRECHMQVGPAFLDQPHDKRRHDVLHEILHVVTADWTDFLNQLMQFVPEEVRDFVENEGDVKMEQAICDLAHALERRGV